MERRLLFVSRVWPAENFGDVARLVVKELKIVLATRPFDPAVYLDTPEVVAVYLSEALETGDSAFIAETLGVVARRAGLSRESLYRGLSENSNPGLGTVLRVVEALGLKLTAVPQPEEQAEPQA